MESNTSNGRAMHDGDDLDMIFFIEVIHIHILSKCQGTLLLGRRNPQGLTETSTQELNVKFILYQIDAQDAHISTTYAFSLMIRPKH
jgi:hypothetical protein